LANETVFLGYDEDYGNCGEDWGKSQIIWEKKC
jgi:hypothetical protein